MPRSSLRVAERHIDKAKSALKRKNFPRQQDLAEAVGVVRSTVNNFLNGKPVDYLNFTEICNFLDLDWQEIADMQEQDNTISSEEVAVEADGNKTNRASGKDENEPKVPVISWSVYDDKWVGRERLVAELIAKMQGDARLLILTGITGIGKSALSQKLAVELQEEWTELIWVNFDDKLKQKDFVSVSSELLTIWGEIVMPDDQKNPQQLLYRLVRRLRENRFLLLIDSLEEILRGNEGEGWSNFEDEWWLKFLQRLLSAEFCQSRLILTSQNLPRELVEAGSRYPNFWYCQLLNGLEKTERLDLFEKTGLDVNTESQGRVYLERIGSAYEGHPLALRVIAGEIKNTFDSDVVAYWNEYGHEIEEVEKAIEEAKKGATSSHDTWKIDRFIDQMRWNVRSRIDQTLNRLEKDVPNAYLLLCEASVYRCAVPESFWVGHLENLDCDEEEQKIAMDALRDRYLVEKEIKQNQLLWRQHNLIRSAALDRLNKMDEDDD